MLRFFRLGLSFRGRVRGRVCLVASTTSTTPPLPSVTDPEGSMKGCWGLPVGVCARFKG